ncbi:hypothetical protein HAZT_HAZT002839 [Hyalella azteca]|uniref:non-specific serine/threonine protein kinase n=1 Tax=Hyalella azteca TaxID=294128 RepID=A0A6A0GWR8_HYAAZ|nr:hypothetical protein HAZT_HAZT002839 [Hyalella azteca]
MVDLIKHPEAETNVKKEMLIHKLLKHPNIIKFFGCRREAHMQYMFLEYAVGGELYDRIDPDIGMPLHLAQRFFRELSYLHDKGIAHRDIKPENLLLDASDTLKITDFGLATLFRHGGRERFLNRRCGTRSYMAPEVLADTEYRAQPADLFGCGVVLVAMLAGELPWDEPTVTCDQFNIWKRRDASYLNSTPWTKVSTCVLSLLRRLLHPTPAQRMNIKQILEHPWMVKHIAETGDLPKKRSRHDNGGFNLLSALISFYFLDEIGFGEHHKDLSDLCSCAALEYYDVVDINYVHATAEWISNKRMCSELDSSFPAAFDERHACSQPQPTARAQPAEVNICAAAELDTDTLCFSQPAKPDHLLLACSPSDGDVSNMTAGGDRCTPLQKLVRRMTRVLVSSSMADTLKHLNDLFEKLHYRTTSHSPNVLTVSTVDRRGAALVMKATVLNMGAHILVDFRRSKGCGLDFKRQFIRIKEELSHIIVKGPVTWSLANASNMLPA